MFHLKDVSLGIQNENENITKITRHPGSNALYLDQKNVSKSFEIQDNIECRFL